MEASPSLKPFAPCFPENSRIPGKNWSGDIRLKNGEIIEEEDIFIRGMTKRPLFFGDVVFKYDDCGVAAGISKKKIDAIISMVNHIEQIEDVGTLMAEIKN